MENNNCELFLFMDGTWKALELSDTIPFPMTYNIADIRDITKRNTTYSKTLEIPGTKNNNDLLNYLFDIANVSSYNVNRKVRCTIVVDTIPVLGDAYFQITDIKSDDNIHFTYECLVIGDTDSIVKDLENKLLTDMDLSDIDHPYSALSVTSSWTKSYSSGYYYGLADFGYNWDISTIGPNSINGTSVSNMLPQIYVRYLWNKMFSEAGWSYESNFIDSGEWDHLLLMGGATLVQSRTYTYLNSFKVGLGSQKVLTLGHNSQIAYTYQGEVNAPLQFGYFGTDPTIIGGFSYPSSPVSVSIVLEDNTNYASFYTSRMQYTDETSGDYHDPSGYWSQTLWEYTVGSSNGYLAVGSSINITIPPATTLFSINSLGIDPPEFIFFDLLLYRSSMPVGAAYNPCNLTDNGFYKSGWKVGYIYGTTSNVPQTENGYTVLTPGNSFIKQFATPLFNQPGVPSLSNPYATLIPGEKLWVKLVARQSGYRGDPNRTTLIGPSFSVTINTDQTYVHNFVDETLIPGQPIDAASALPKEFKQIDFFTGMIKMFNLYVEPDKTISKRLRMEPRDDYYNSGVERNWTSKVDISQEVRQQVIADTQSKQLYLTYKQDKDAYNDDYFNKTKEVYGQYKYVVDNDFIKGDNKIEVPFASTPVKSLPGTNELSFDSMILPIIAKNNSGSMTSTDFMPRILYRSTAGVVSFSDPDNYWKFNGVTYPYYPYIGHFNLPRTGTRDLNFGETEFLYYHNNLITDNNLYNLYYQKQLNELTDRDSKIVTVNMRLTPQDMNDFSFRDRIIIDGISSGTINYFRVNKIDYDPTSKGTFKVELLKAKDIPKRTISGTTTIGNIAWDVGIGVGIRMGINNTVYTPRSLTIGEGNLSYAENPNSAIFGDMNVMETRSKNVMILGDNNRVKSGTRSTLVIGDNIITKVGQSGLILSTAPTISINYIDAGLDMILNPFPLSTTINYIDAGEDTILPIGGDVMVYKIDASKNEI